MHLLKQLNIRASGLGRTWIYILISLYITACLLLCSVYTNIEYFLAELFNFQS